MIRYSFIVVILLCAFTAYGQTGLFRTPQDYNQWKTLDDFELCSNWTLFSDDLETVSNAHTKLDPTPGIGLMDYTVMLRRVKSGASFNLHGETFLYQRQKENVSNRYGKGTPYQNYSLGARINYPIDAKMTVLIEPKKPYPLIGHVSYLRMWVLGRGDNYQVDIWIRDYTGTLQVIPVTKTDFIGWRLCKIPIPPTIPQNWLPYPERKILWIEGIAVTNRGGELAHSFYVYFDQLEMKTDTFLPWFDGQDIPDGW